MLHRKLRLIGYLRTGGCALSAREQRNIIREYCVNNGHRLVGFTEVDLDRPSFGLQEALAGLKKSDGIVAASLELFVAHSDDRLMDIRPFVEMMMHKGKALVTLLDGFETISAGGQLRILELINEWSAHEALSPVTRGELESNTAAANY